MANLTLKHGTTGASAHGYVWLGTYLGPVFHRYADGYRFAKLALDLVEKHDFVAYKAKISLGIGYVACWTQPLTASIDFYRTAFYSGIETGDLVFACYGCNSLLKPLLIRGDPLDEVWHESEKSLAFARKLKYRDIGDLICYQQRFIQNMRGRTLQYDTLSAAQFDGVAIDRDASGGEGFDEATFEAQLSGDRSPMTVCWYWILKVQARFMFGDYEVAIAAAEKAKTLLWAGEGFIQTLDYHYFTALTIAAIWEKLTPEQRNAFRTQLIAHCEQLQEWAEIYPPTFGDKHALVSAEVARLEGRDADAMLLYEQAIVAARENGFPHYEGIAHETAAGFYLARRFTTAGYAHLNEARTCFARWGADSKVRQLDARYPQLRASANPALPSNMAVGGVAQLDVLSVTKASQAISGRIVLDELVNTLMRIVLESAGAQTGYLLLARGEDLVLAAEASVAQQTVQVRPHLGQALPASPLPSAILNYVRRSQTQVLLADATEPNPFSADPYLARRQPKSVLCLPIVRQTTLIGVLYLENTLITHAFTPQRVTVLELLASQAAISLENALLYTDLQQENSERKRVEDTLREREARIRRLVDSNIIGIFFWDLQGRISDANDAFLRLIGYGRQELLSGQVQWAQMTPPEYVAADARAIEEIRHAGTCSTYEKAFVRKDGTRLPVLIGAALLEGSQDNGVAFVLDLTERKQAEAERTARQAAEAANRAKSTFLANMSHELRTPLNSVLGYAQILERDPVLGERQLAGVNVIRKSGEHLLTLINDILDLAKIEASKMVLYLADFPLLPFVQGIANMASVKAAQKGLELVCDLGSGLPQGIRADEKRLRQVLLNLLSNAIKFTDRGLVTLRVRFAPPQRLCFEVQDTGIGIAPDQLATIFEPFEQAGDMRRRLGGTGLGLAISRQYMRLMGGEIQVESRPGQGSTFRIEVEAPPVQVAAAMTVAKTVTGYAGPRKKILIVDDIAENRAVVIDLLTPLGFEVAEASNGHEGLELAHRLRPDLILMDIVMPELDGLEAARLLRQQEALRDVPIIALSASVSVSDNDQCLAAGMNAFLPKPLEADKLLEQMAKLLQLEWVYGTAPIEAEPEPIVVPPADEMEVLHQLARLGNMQHIMAQADRLAQLDERYRPFANRLSFLAKDYQSQAILSMVNRYLK
jgi:PAS domain S-box-containing protein